MPSALIVGAFGQDNPGDEALLAASVRAVRASAGWEPVVATARPVDTAAQLDVATVPATGPATARAAAHADALVVGGGTVFKELHAASGRAPGALLRRAAALASAFHARGRPVALIGVGAAPIMHPANRRLARSLARRSDLLVLRDAESALLLTGIGVPGPLRVGADLGWLAASGSPTAPQPSPPSDRDRPVGVALSHLAGEQGLVDRLAAALRAIGAAGYPIELEPWQGSPLLGADAQLAKRLGREIGPGATVVPPPDDLADATGRMARRATVLALRFHAAVAAAQAGTRFVAVAHEPKLTAIADRTGQRRVAVSDSAATIAAQVRHSIGGPPPSASAVADQHRRAAATVDLLGLVLSGDGDAGRLAHLDPVPDPVPA